MQIIICEDTRIDIYAFEIHWVRGWDHDAGEFTGKAVMLAATDSRATAERLAEFHAWDVGSRYGSGLVVITDGEGNLVGDTRETRRIAIAV